MATSIIMTIRWSFQIVGPNFNNPWLEPSNIARSLATQQQRRD